MASNVLGGDLIACSTSPMTGFLRNGYCEACGDDSGMHTICALMDERFLAFSKERGNDLGTPRPEVGFPGLNPGDYWCVCLSRWVEAYQHGVVPKVKLEATHLHVLEFIDLEVLKEHAVGAARE